MADYDIPGNEGLALHHFYRVMAWVGGEFEEKPKDALAPRCVKDPGSVLPRLTEGLTYLGGISFTVCPSFAISRAQ